MRYWVLISSAKGHRFFAYQIYEYLITFDNERNLMWPMSFKSPAKWLFFVTRYLPFVDMTVLIAREAAVFSFEALLIAFMRIQNISNPD